MQTINLKQYYPFCKEDIFVEVSDEIVEAFLLDKRAEAARDRKMFRYKAFYSLDCNDGIENAAIGWAQPSPEDYLIEKEELAEYEELIRRLYEAISSLPPMQARRVHARYMLGTTSTRKSVVSSTMRFCSQQMPRRSMQTVIPYGTPPKRWRSNGTPSLQGGGCLPSPERYRPTSTLSLSGSFVSSRLFPKA